MAQPPELTDRRALERNRRRSMAEARFLLQEVVCDTIERLKEVNRPFTKTALVAAFPEDWAPLGASDLVPDAPLLEFPKSDYSAVIHGFCLHWANDPVGQLIQARRALAPDGLFIASLFGGQTLHELRAALAMAETEVTGGLSPRVLPMADIRDLGALLQRAGFALPVADSWTRTVHYKSLTGLMRDLRAMGEANALSDRLRRPTRRRILERAEEIYRSSHATDDGKLIATFEIVTLTGWAPDASQPQPLRPGSATTRLAEALGTAEEPAGEQVFVRPRHKD
ncbi:MAG: SAM-dependent methyltransferase [Pseudomonadota bacterium]